MEPTVCHNTARHNGHTKMLITSQGKAICSCGELHPIHGPKRISIVLELAEGKYRYNEVISNGLDGKHKEMFHNLGGEERIKQALSETGLIVTA
jgi:hypothetical protein